MSLRTTLLGACSALILLQLAGPSWAGELSVSPASGSPPFLAQVSNPADAMRRPAAVDSSSAGGGRLRSYELPEVVVVGERRRRLREEQRVGAYRQPRWTATRRFPTTRVYVVPQGKVEFEAWIRPTWKDDGTVEMRSLWEMEFGLPHRFQLDLYLRTDQVLDPGGSASSQGQQIEVRWAWADWGRIWGNPTFYLEWVNRYDEPDKIEPKLLLGGQLAEGLHAGANLVAELELGGAREYEYEVTAGLSRTIHDSRLALGVESRCAISDVAADRGRFTENLRLGPSLQFRPLDQMTVNVAPLFGLTSDSDDAQLFVNVGWEF